MAFPRRVAATVPFYPKGISGSTGYQPVPAGNLSDGMAVDVEKQEAFAITVIPSISFGRLPKETGW